MREILFRAKRIDNGEWVEGNVIHSYDADKEYKTIIIPVKCSDMYTDTDDKDIGFETWYKVNPETLCQYTGLNDKNGKRIWENDIVSAWSEGKYATGKVKQRIDGLYIIYPAYQHNEFWGLCPDKNRKTNVEVIGNIFYGGINGQGTEE